MSDPGPFDQVAKALAHRPRLLAIARGDFQPPASVKIELTTACNHDCHFCAYRRVVQADKKQLPLELVLRLIDDLAGGGVSGVMFTGGGEPLAHPDAEAVFAACRARRLPHALITNGTLLGRISDEALAGLRWIRFSINGAGAEEYARVHGAAAADWDRVWAQVARAARIASLTVGVSLVVTSWNRGGLEAAAARARDSGAAYFHVRPAFTGPDSELDRQLDGDEIAEDIARLEKLRGDFPVHGISRRFREIQSPPREHIHCRSTPLVSYVLPDGNVSLCTLVRSRDFNAAVGDPFLGSLHEHRFFELWNTPRHHQLIAALSSSGCTRCHFSEYNRALEMVEQDRLHLDFL